MSGEQKHPEPDGAEERVEDLDVPGSESEEVKGGSLNYSKIEFEYRQPKKHGVIEDVGVKYT